MLLLTGLLLRVLPAISAADGSGAHGRDGKCSGESDGRGSRPSPLQETQRAVASEDEGDAPYLSRDIEDSGGGVWAGRVGELRSEFEADGEDGCEEEPEHSGSEEKEAGSR